MEEILLPIWFPTLATIFIFGFMEKLEHNRKIDAEIEKACGKFRKLLEDYNCEIDAK